MNEEQTNLIAAVNFIYSASRTSSITADQHDTCRKAGEDLIEFIKKSAEEAPLKVKK